MQGTIQRTIFAVLAAVVASVAIAAIIGAPNQSQAALLEDGDRARVLIGKDDDNLNNTTIQPPGQAADQSLTNTDVLTGGGSNDVLIGLLGSDVMKGGSGKDILIGGTEQATRPNSDVMFGEDGDDVNVWAGGDGNDAFLGGRGHDALIFGTIDRDANNVPTLTGPVPNHPTGVPTANVSGQGAFCTIEDGRSLGYDHLVRFVSRATGAFIVTVRVSDTEQVFCANQAGGQIAFADLKKSNPRFVEVSPEKVAKLNRDVSRIVR